MFTNAGRTPDAGVTGILLAHPGAFSSDELTNCHLIMLLVQSIRMSTARVSEILMIVNYG